MDAAAQGYVIVIDRKERKLGSVRRFCRKKHAVAHDAAQLGWL